MAQSTNILERTVAGITELPVLPEALATLIRLLQDPRTTAEDIGRAVSAEPALVSKMLKLVNSAFYGFPARIGTVSQAVVILGHHTIRNLVLTTSVVQSLKQVRMHPLFDLRDFWEHAVGTAAAARLLAEDNGGNGEEAFIGGLLHDIGRLVICQHLREAWSDIVAMASGGADMGDAELRVLGFGHDEMGAWLARSWNFPSDLCLTIEFHHHPGAAPAENGSAPGAGDRRRPLPWEIVHAANLLSQALVGRNRLEAHKDALHPLIWAQVCSSAEILEDFGRRYRQETEKARIFLRILEE